MKKVAFTLFLFCSTLPVFAQQTKTDSLLNLLNTAKEDTIKVDLLTDLGSESGIAGDFDKGLNYVKEAKLLAEKLNYKKGIANAISSSGYLNWGVGNYEESLKDQTAALKLREEIGDKKGIAKSYNSLGLIYWQQGKYAEAKKDFTISMSMMIEMADTLGIANCKFNIGLINSEEGNYPETLKNYLEALKLYQKGSFKKGIANSHNNIGVFYKTKGELDKALQNFWAALKLYSELNSSGGVANSYNNIGEIYIEKSDFSEALKYITNALNTRKKMGEKKGIADCYLDIGSIFLKKRNYKDALENYFLSLKIYTDQGIKQRMASTYISIGEAYIGLKNYGAAKKYLDNAISISKVIGSKPDITDSYKALVKLDSAKGDFKMAYNDYRVYIVYRDSLSNEENAKKITQAKMQYDFDMKEAATKSENEKKTLLANAEIKRQRLIKNSTLGGVGIAGLFSYFLLSSRNKKRKTSFEKQVAEVETKALRSQINPHFIFNSLNSIDDYILNNDIKNSSLYVNKFSRLMRLILESSRKEEIAISEDLEALKLYIQLENLRMPNSVECVIDVEPEINTEQTLIPPMLLQPFVENAFKHAFYNVENPKLEIKIFLKGEMLFCTITDNGKGRHTIQKLETETRDKRNSLGMVVTRERLDIISKLKRTKAYFAFEDLKDIHHNAMGTKVELFVPASYSF